MGIFKRGRPYRNELTYLQKIAKWFFTPLLQYKPEDLSKQAYLEQLFHTKYRRIDQYESRRVFLMPGLFAELPTRHVPDEKARRVERRQRLFVRHDTRSPDSFQVSFFSGQGGAEVVYELTANEWNRIKTCLKKVGETDEAVTGY